MGQLEACWTSGVRNTGVWTLVLLLHPWTSAPTSVHEEAVQREVGTLESQLCHLLELGNGKSLNLPEP